MCLCSSIDISRRIFLFCFSFARVFFHLRVFLVNCLICEEVYPSKLFYHNHCNIQVSRMYEDVTMYAKNVRRPTLTLIFSDMIFSLFSVTNGNLALFNTFITLQWRLFKISNVIQCPSHFRVPKCDYTFLFHQNVVTLSLKSKALITGTQINALK